jgi:hypothetical protein
MSGSLKKTYCQLYEVVVTCVFEESKNNKNLNLKDGHFQVMVW